MKYFGSYNENKKRYSFSGKCIPKYGKYNYNGLIMICDNNNNIYIVYSNKKDTRNIDMPDNLKKNLIIAVWYEKSLNEKINKKFNRNGFIIINKDKNNYYNELLFGENITFNTFINNIKLNKIFFDSGMYEGNNRNYSHFRANKSFWLDLIYEIY